MSPRCFCSTSSSLFSDFVLEDFFFGLFFLLSSLSGIELELLELFFNCSLGRSGLGRLILLSLSLKVEEDKIISVVDVTGDGVGFILDVLLSIFKAGFTNGLN